MPHAHAAVTYALWKKSPYFSLTRKFHGERTVRRVRCSNGFRNNTSNIVSHVVSRAVFGPGLRVYPVQET